MFFLHSFLRPFFPFILVIFHTYFLPSFSTLYHSSIPNCLLPITIVIYKFRKHFSINTQCNAVRENFFMISPNETCSLLMYYVTVCRETIIFLDYLLRHRRQRCRFNVARCAGVHHWLLLLHDKEVRLNVTLIVRTEVLYGVIKKLYFFYEIKYILS